MPRFETWIAGKRTRDIDATNQANHAAGLALYYARNEADFDLETEIEVQAVGDEHNGLVEVSRPDVFTVKDILEWIRLGAGRPALDNEPAGFYDALEELAEEMLPPED